MFDDFYGLDGRPFQLTPDPVFFFESHTHRKALSYLGYGLAQGEGFVVITGEVGAGKSTLVAHLMATIDPARLTAAQVVTSRLDGEEIVHVVAQAFGLMIEGHDKAGALGAIEGFLHEEARAGRRCLLIVDESQNLSVDALEELRMLSNFQLGAHPLLQTLLLGQPEFRDTLLEHSGLEQLRQRVIATYHLEAMEANEVQPYIEHRLKCVGWESNPAFDQRVFADIHSATDGIPRRINQIVNRLLLLGSVEERTRIDGAMLQQVLSELNEDGTMALLRAAPTRQPQVLPEPAAEAEVDEAEKNFVEAETDRVEVDEDDTDDGDSAEFDAVEFGSVEFGANEGVADKAETEEDVAESEDESPQVSEAADKPVRDRIAPINFARPFESGDSSLIEETLAEHDGEISALRQAVYDLAGAASDDARSGSHASAAGDIAELKERIATMEGRLLEQDLTIRHTLTMLIEWIENGEDGREAA